MVVCLIVRHGGRDPFRGHMIPPPSPLSPPQAGGYYQFRVLFFFDAMTPLGDTGMFCEQAGVCVGWAYGPVWCPGMAMSSSAVSHHMQGNNWGKLTLGLGTTRQKARWGTVS